MAVLLRLRDNEPLRLNNNLPFILGRTIHCTEQLSNRLISKQHLQVFYEHQKWYIKDTSANGTYINNVKLHNARRELRNQDVIQVAKYAYAFIEGEQVPSQRGTEDNVGVEVIIIDDDNDGQTALNEPDFPIIDPISQEELTEELSCCICTELYVNPIIVDCGHNFCKLCITKWHASNPGCPTCRQSVTVQVPNVTLNNLVEMMIRKMSDTHRAMRASLTNQHKTQLDMLVCSHRPIRRTTRGRRTRRGA